MELRVFPGVNPPKQVLVEYYRCEQHNTCHFYASDEFMQFMKRVFASACSNGSKRTASSKRSPIIPCHWCWMPPTILSSG
jgi:hypothetical protein